MRIIKMKKYLSGILLSIMLIMFSSIEFRAQTIQPVLISPPDGSTYQKTKNLDLSWLPKTGLQLFVCQYALDNKFKKLEGSYILTGNTLTVNNLLNDTIYYWRVRIFSSDTLWSNVWSFRTTPLPVKPIVYYPTTFLKDIHDTLTFIWNYNIINKSYLLQLASDPNFANIEINTTSNDTSLTLHKLKGERIYYWHVRGLNIDFIPGEWSNVYKFKTGLNAPEIISPYNDLSNADTVLTFQWYPVDSAKNYLFQLSLSKSFQSDSILFENMIDSAKITIDSLPPRTILFWRVIAFSSSGESSFWSDINSFRTRLTNLYFISPKNGLINQDTLQIFSWYKINGAENYRILISEDDKFSKIIFDKVIRTTFVIFDSLEYYHEYFWKVIAGNRNGDSSFWSNTSYLKTRLKTPILSPKDSLKNVPVNQVLSWTSVPGGELYSLQLSDNAAFIEPLIDTVLNKFTYRPSDLEPDSLYFWRVVAFNYDNDSSRWAVHRFRTRPAILVILDSLRKNVNLYNNTSDTLGIISFSNAGVNQYIIDSIKINPDTVFFLDKKSALIQPNSSLDFLLRFRALKADTGVNSAVLNFIRITSSFTRDTLKYNLLFTLKAAKAKFSSDSIQFNEAPPNAPAKKLLTISNRGGNYPLSINKIIKSGTDTSSFKLINPPKGIKSNDSVSFYVEFKPDKPLNQQAVIEFQTNAYPLRNIEIALEGKGIGGELADETVLEIKKAVADTFETFNNNNKKIFFKNTGNKPMNITITFPKNWFKVTNDFQSYFSLRPNDTVTVGIKYLTPNFNIINFDTLSIIHNGFGEDTIKLPVAGGFDSLKSSAKLKNNLSFNKEPFINSVKIIEDEQPVTLVLNPSLFDYQNYLNFRLDYYLGGPGKVHNVYNDGNYNFKIPKEDITEKGVILTGELIARNSLGKIIDSISVFDSVDIQTITPKLKTSDISVPRSIPAENKNDAKVKWILFGFPYEEVIADSVFEYFGGMKNMKDGEWIVYKYDPTVSDSFSLFSDYYFKETSAYFMAQSLLDTFKISYMYPQNIRSRKLSDNKINFNGNGWKTVSSPFVFDVQVDSTLILRRYDTNTKSYKMTNVMKPGEGYFVEPDIRSIKLLTFGKYNPLYFPKVLADIGWFVKLNITDVSASNELYFSIIKSGSKLSKSKSLKKEYIIPPKLEEGLDAYISGEEINNKLDVSVKEGSTGAQWDFVIGNNNSGNSIIINSVLNGKMPDDFRYIIYDSDDNKKIEQNEKIYTGAGFHFYKMIIGTQEYINEALQKIQNTSVNEFRLEQNYPNPFNPVTTIKYSIPSAGTSLMKSPQLIQLKVFDILGREVATLVNEEKPSGNYTIDFNASSLASGIYFYELKTGSYSAVKKMILLK